MASPGGNTTIDVHTFLKAARGSPSIAEVCRADVQRLRSIPFPPSPHDDTTVRVIQMLMEQRLRLVMDAAFGVLLSRYLPTEAPEPWFERLDRAPNDGDAHALLDLLSPDGPLFQLLLELSCSPPSFDMQLQTQWRGFSGVRPPAAARPLDGGPSGGGPAGPDPAGLLGDGAGRVEDDGDDVVNPMRPENSLAASFGVDAFLNFPLCDFSFAATSITGEPADADITKLPTDRVPALLTIPAWQPPITRASVSGKKDEHMGTWRECIAMTPALYFLCRMLAFLPAAADGEAAVQDLLPAPHAGYAEHAKQLMNQLCSQVPFLRAHLSFETAEGAALRSANGGGRFLVYRELVRRYAEFFAPHRAGTSAADDLSQPCFANDSFGRGGGRSQGTRRSSSLQLHATAFVHAMTAMWARTQVPLSEADRMPITAMGSISALFQSLPSLADLVEAMSIAAPNDGPRTPSHRPLQGRSRRGSVARLPPSQQLKSVADEVTYSTTHLYRHVLRTLRAVLASTANVFRLPPCHVVAVLRLFRVTLQFGHSAGGGSDGSESIVATRYELLSVVLQDVMRMLVEHAQLPIATYPELQGTVAVLRETGRFFAAITPLVPALNRAASSIEHARRGDHHAVDPLVHNAVLRWDDDATQRPEASWLIPALTGPAAQAKQFASAVQGLRATQPSPAAPGGAEGETVADLADATLLHLRCCFPDCGRSGGGGGARQHPQTVRFATHTDDSRADRSVSHSLETSSTSGVTSMTARHTPGRFARRTRLLADDPDRRPSTWYGRSQFGPVGAEESADVVFHRRSKAPPSPNDSRLALWLLGYIESGIHFLRLRWAASRGDIPTGPDGQPMTLTDSVFDECPGWQSKRSGVRFGMSPPPVTPQGYVIELEDLEASPWANRSVVCDRCCLVLPPYHHGSRRDAIQRYYVPVLERFLCPDCAATPFEVPQLRRLASKTLWLHMVAVAVVVWFGLTAAGYLFRSPDHLRGVRAKLAEVDDMA